MEKNQNLSEQISGSQSKNDLENEPQKSENSNLSESIFETLFNSIVADKGQSKGDDLTEKSEELASDVEEKSENLAPDEALILGKFKTVEELTKAYQELQKLQGQNSAELGNLRKNVKFFNDLGATLMGAFENQNAFLKCFERDREKYNTPEYFQDPTFNEIYKEAIYALGENLDTEKLVNLLEGYVASRIFANEKRNSANDETENVLNSMMYGSNPKNKVKKPKKSLDEMSQKEIDELLDEII